MSPFAAYPRSMFSAKEIQDRWMDSILDNVSRLKNINSLKIQEKNFCLFAKIDSGIYFILYLYIFLFTDSLILFLGICIAIFIGTTPEQRETKVNALNMEYSSMRVTNDQTTTLYDMARNHPYRLFSLKVHINMFYKLTSHFFFSHY